jgi:hypothetical protein
MRGPRFWSDTAIDVLFYVVLISTAAISLTAACCTAAGF